MVWGDEPLPVPCGVGGQARNVGGDQLLEGDGQMTTAPPPEPDPTPEPPKQDPPVAEPPKAPAPPAAPAPGGGEDIIAERAEHARIKAELETLKAEKAKPKAPAPQKKAPAPVEDPPVKKRSRVARSYWGDVDDD